MVFSYRRPLPACACHSPRFIQHAFAWFLHSQEDAMHKAYYELKEPMLGSLTGNIIEIGPGAGANFRYYRRDVKLHGIEPNPYMHDYLRDEANVFDLDLTLHPCGAESIPIENDFADAVVCTLVLCSVDDPAAILAESRRVLKPGGRFLFIEHVAAAAGTLNRSVQNIIRPAWSWFGDGCCPNRETWKAIEQAGFGQVHLDHFRSKVPIPFIKPHIAGYAVK